MGTRDPLTRHLVSPYGLAAASFGLFLFAYLFPPALYSKYIPEPDFLFLDPASLLFFFLCTLGFVAGVLAIDYACPVHHFARAKRLVHSSPARFILLPLLLGIAWQILADVKLMHDNPHLLELLLIMQGSELKMEGGIEASGPIYQVTPILMGLVWWALFRRDELNLSKYQRIAVNCGIVLATIALLLSSTLMLSRGQLMPILCGVAIVILLVKWRDGKLSAASAFRLILSSLAVIAALFMGFSVLRGLSGMDSLLTSVLAYTISSYNRLACLLGGALRYPFAGHGIYISGFFSFNHSFNALFHPSRLLDWADFDTVWRSEFDAVSAVGLRGTIIWSGTFGYLFSDLGWFTPLLLIVYGLITGWAWRNVRMARVSGLLLYPWCAFCILFWFGTNDLFDDKAIVLLIFAPLLSLYESWSMRSVAEVQ